MKSNPHSMRRHTEWAVKDVQCISDCYVSPARLVNPDYFARFNAWWDLSMAKWQFRGGLWNWCLTIEMAMQPCSVCIAVISFSNVKHHQVRSGICSWLSSDKQHARMGFNVVRFIHFLQCLSHCRWFKRVAEAIPLPLCCKRCAFLSCEVQASLLSSPLAAGVIKSALPIPGERDLIACLPPWAFHPPPPRGVLFSLVYLHPSLSSLNPASNLNHNNPAAPTSHTLAPCTAPLMSVYETGLASLWASLDVIQFAAWECNWRTLVSICGAGPITVHMPRREWVPFGEKLLRVRVGIPWAVWGGGGWSQPFPQHPASTI